MSYSRCKVILPRNKIAKHDAMQTVASILGNPDPQVLRLFINEDLAGYTPKPPPRLLDQVRIAIRTRHYSRRTEKAYVGWIRRYILFHGKCHPTLMGEREVTDFLSHLATAAHVSASTQNQALSALLFLYKEVLGQNLGWLNDVVRAQHRQKLPVVLSEAEVAAVIRELRGVAWLAASLIYGAGLRQLECLRLRVKDVDFDRREIVVRHGKGGKDRRTVLPGAASPLRSRRTWRRPIGSTRLILRAEQAMSSCLTPLAVSIPMRHGNGAGSGCFRRPVFIVM